MLVTPRYPVKEASYAHLAARANPIRSYAQGALALDALLELA